jgi:hypothetical protein
MRMEKNLLQVSGKYLNEMSGHFAVFEYKILKILARDQKYFRFLQGFSALSMI